MSDPKAIITFTKTQPNDTYPFISPSKADLSGRHVLITGGSKGIGRAIAISFAQAGASAIALLARSPLDETVKFVRKAASDVGRPEPKILQLKCDTTSEQEVAQAAKNVEAEFGKLDVLINNAGYLEAWKTIVESEPREWWKSWEVNVKGTYLVSRAFIPLLLRTEAGLKTIATVASMGGIVTMPHASAYESSKTAQIRLTNFLCAEYKDQGLLAFTLHPGGVKTELSNRMPEYMHALLNDTPELAGDSVVWLTRERRDWLMDRFVSVQWDMSELEQMKGEIVEKDLLKFKMAV